MADVYNLGHEVRNAMDWLQSAIETAGELCTEEKGTAPDGSPIYGPNGWKAMEEACARLDEVRKLLAESLKPVEDALEEERRRLDGGASEEDIHGFRYHHLA